MTRLSTATALGLILAASPALAEITPSSVWQQINSYYGTVGMTVQTEAVEEAGDTVTVRGLVLSQEAPDSSSTINLGDMVLTATGDGGVQIDLADQATTQISFQVPKSAAPMEAAPAEDGAADPANEAVPMDMPATDGAATDAADAAADAAAAAADAANQAAEAAAEAATDAANDAAEAATDAANQAADATDTAIAEPEMGTVTVDLTMSMPGETVTVREDGAANVYELNFPTTEIAVSRIETVDGDVIENPGKITVANFVGTQRMETDGGAKVTQSGTADSVDGNFAYEDDEGAAVGVFNLGTVAFNSDGVIPQGADMATGMSTGLAKAMEAGLDLKGDLKLGSMSIKLDVTDKTGESGPQPISISSTAADLGLNFALGGGNIAYSGGAGASNTEATIPDLPVPVSYASESSMFDIMMPIAPSAEEMPFKMVYGFKGLTLSDSIWGMFDPQTILPRDPANVTVDLSGTGKMNVDITDPEALRDPSVVPGEVTSLKINNVDISALGASIAATGELTSPAGGNLSTPLGKINGTLTGVNGLFDKLIQAGLMPEDQAMGMRMMLAMFAKADPANAEVMTSEIEFKEGGSIFANGQQVK